MLPRRRLVALQEELQEELQEVQMWPPAQLGQQVQLGPQRARLEELARMRPRELAQQQDAALQRVGGQGQIPSWPPPPPQETGAGALAWNVPEPGPSPDPG